MAYAKELTREYLESLGVEYVSFDGKEILVKGKPKKQHLNNAGYYIISLYDPDIRQSIPKEKRNSSSGQIYIPVHRLVYAWWNGKATKIIDHIDNNKTNNDPYNLQELTVSENINKNRVRRVLKCKLTIPREFYQERYDYFDKLYQQAKKDKDVKAQHSYRTSRAHYEAKLAYYDQALMEKYFEDNKL